MTDEEYKYADKILLNLLGLEKNCNHIPRFAQYELKIGREQTRRLIIFLESLNAIEPWKGMHRLTETGKEIANLSGKTKEYVENLERIRQSKITEENKEATKRKNERTLSKWKVWTFWPAFVLGVIGGLYSILSIVLLLTGTSIERIMQGKSGNIESLQEQTEKVIIDQLDANDEDVLQLSDTLIFE